MPKGYWLKRLVMAFVVAAVVLFAAQLLRGHGAADAVGFAAMWGAIAAAIYTLTGYYRYRRNPACMLPRSKEPPSRS